MSLTYSPLSETVISSSVASVSFSLGNGFNTYQVICSGLSTSDTANTNNRLRYRVSDDNGSTFESGSNYWSNGERKAQAHNSGEGATENNGGNQLKTEGCLFRFAQNAKTNVGCNLFIYGANDTNLTCITSFAYGGSATSSANGYMVSVYDQTTVVTDIQLFWEYGNITSGKIKVIGLY